MKNLRQNVRKNGWRYILYRLLQALRMRTDALAYGAVLESGEVDQLLRKAFPGRCYSLEDLGQHVRIPGARRGKSEWPGGYPRPPGV